jgi:lipid II:glycine glycyltransferase (peptidoglycan interpeptide bridge formation enzyme)
MKLLIKEGYAYLVVAEDEQGAKGAALYITAENKVYYGIGAFDRSMERSGLSHACMWKAIEHAKQQKYTVFETGHTFYSSVSFSQSEKERGIGFFKRGFGGSNHPILVITA